MEEYRKEPGSSTTNNDDSNQPPAADNEIRVSNSSSIKSKVGMGLDKLKTYPNIVVVGKGNTINKAITIVEIIKRRMDGTLHQYNQIGTVTSTEQWAPIKDNELDSITVKKMLPITIIYLSSTPMPELESTATYQAPHKYD
ncbi:uncharacterized protein BX664DRAFT_347947 [Halteromyces radiatus]|uniref:uncharacterized protein n=1 Tax=Halteromyces radiatus TaxID=101107 RepID=UPI00222074E4|nr:uncharacterized protein BX664DRAFT_347947 [Halteromyces radiatus]KAI8092677.1 hypothetical protein BX664DRAFT_347947 [Halteromyces radiatus]